MYLLAALAMQGSTCNTFPWRELLKVMSSWSHIAKVYVLRRNITKLHAWQKLVTPSIRELLAALAMKASICNPLVALATLKGVLKATPSTCFRLFKRLL